MSEHLFLYEAILTSTFTQLPAHEIVFATGYENMRGTAGKIFGSELAERVQVGSPELIIRALLIYLQDVWGFDDEGELRTMWR